MSKPKQSAHFEKHRDESRGFTVAGLRATFSAEDLMIEALRLWMAVYTVPALGDDERYELKCQAAKYSRAAGVEGFPTDKIKL